MRERISFQGEKGSPGVKGALGPIVSNFSKMSKLSMKFPLKSLEFSLVTEFFSLKKKNRVLKD